MSKHVFFQINADMRHVFLVGDEEYDVTLAEFVAIYQGSVLRYVGRNAVQVHSVNSKENLTHKTGAVDSRFGTTAVLVWRSVPLSYFFVMFFEILRISVFLYS